MLPGRDGLKVLRDLRSQGYPRPVLILTARDAVEDRVAGLDCGADDYLVKPFAFAELLARLRADCAATSPAASSFSGPMTSKSTCSPAALCALALSWT